MLIVGLTGGIGSGKSSISALFAQKGIPVYIADRQAKRLMQTDPVLKQGIIREFGAESYKGTDLNRAYLAAKVFGSKTELAKLNALVHPVVHRDLLDFAARQKAAFIIYENAILFENGSDALCDYIITVTAPVSERIRRVMARDNMEEKQVLARMQHQWSDAEKIERSDFVIENIEWEQSLFEFDCIYKALMHKVRFR